ncbi:hypothetical protein CTA1_11226 [Colletotrichum tanaceti]|uniref:Uncharacterized protein n=1 Tax=Colletotrichum tanaceti TaxID=1306861 RepID=A0A4V6DFX4_9PEZI|nr:hypothetical protein CTA1_11226 [Colletotrichum tanaceti]
MRSGPSSLLLMQGLKFGACIQHCHDHDHDHDYDIDPNNHNHLLLFFLPQKDHVHDILGITLNLPRTTAISPDT